MRAQINIKNLVIVFIITLVTASCTIDVGGSGGSDSELGGTLSAQGTQLSHLATQVNALEDTIQSQGDVLSYLATQMPLALERVTPIPPGTTLVPTPFETLQSPTPFPVCTPPACAPDEMYYCHGECPGGCGTTCATATPGTSSGSGQVWGEICYPSEITPSMTLYFQDTRTLEILSFSIPESQPSYRFTIPAGVYVAFAWLPDQVAAGSYSEYVLCGGGESCTDHNLVPFLVQAGYVTTGVDICDWYGDPELLPPVP